MILCTFTAKKSTGEWVLKKNVTILKFEERLDHGNGNGYLLAARLYTSLNDAGKRTCKGKIRKVKRLQRQKVRNQLQ